MIFGTATSLVAAIGLALAAQADGRIYDYLKLKDMEALGLRLRSQIAHVKVTVKRASSDPLSAEERDGFAIILDEHHLAVLCFIVKDAARVEVAGPRGKTTFASVLHYDVVQRVAILETSGSLAKLGLFPAPRAPSKGLVVEQPVYALTGTEGDPQILQGWLKHNGKEEGLEGHPRISLKLTHGMPVFDAKARVIGYSRHVAWDRDRFMLVPWDKIEQVFSRFTRMPKTSKKKQ